MIVLLALPQHPIAAEHVAVDERGGTARPAERYARVRVVGRVEPGTRAGEPAPEGLRVVDLLADVDEAVDAVPELDPARRGHDHGAVLLPRRGRRPEEPDRADGRPGRVDEGELAAGMKRVDPRAHTSDFDPLREMDVPRVAQVQPIGWPEGDLPGHHGADRVDVPVGEVTYPHDPVHAADRGDVRCQGHRSALDRMDAMRPARGTPPREVVSHADVEADVVAARSRVVGEPRIGCWRWSRVTSHPRHVSA